MPIAVATHGMRAICAVFSGPYEWRRTWRPSPADWRRRSNSSWNSLIAFLGTVGQNFEFWTWTLPVLSSQVKFNLMSL